MEENNVGFILLKPILNKGCEIQHLLAAVYAVVEASLT